VAQLPVLNPQEPTRSQNIFKIVEIFKYYFLIEWIKIAHHILMVETVCVDGNFRRHEICP